MSRIRPKNTSIDIFMKDILSKRKWNFQMNPEFCEKKIRNGCRKESKRFKGKPRNCF